MELKYLAVLFVLVLSLQFVFSFSLDDFLSFFSDKNTEQVQIKDNSNLNVNTNGIETNVDYDLYKNNSSDEQDLQVDTSIKIENSNEFFYTLLNNNSTFLDILNPSTLNKYHGIAGVDTEFGYAATYLYHHGDKFEVGIHLSEDYGFVSEKWKGQTIYYSEFKDYDFKPMSRLVFVFDNFDSAFTFFKYLKVNSVDDYVGATIVFSTNDCSKDEKGLFVCKVTVDSEQDTFTIY